MIDKNKQYRTRDGREVRIYATDGGGDWPVHGSVNSGWGHTSTVWRSGGKGQGSSLDLIEVKPRIKREYWVNVFHECESHFLHKDKAYADASSYGRIACVKVVIDCEEGDGK